MKEEWKQVVDGTEVSTIGRVRKTYTPKKTRSVEYTRLSIKGYDSYKNTHQIMYTVFKGEIPKGYVIDHIDGNKQNNAIDNLEAVTREENGKRWAARRTKQMNKDYAGKKCRKGHDKQGRKWCLTCRREQRRTRYERRQLPEGNWKPWLGYMISDKGEVWSNYIFKLIKPSETKTGYLTKQLNKPHKGKRYWPIHRIVYEAWVGDVPEGMVVDHIDSNKKNNNVSNLEVVTYSENAKRAWKKRKRKTKQCSRCEHTFKATSQTISCPECGSREYIYLEELDVIHS